MTKKLTKIHADSDQFAKEAANLALSYVTIMQCRKCSHPVVDGYCCGFCGSEYPTKPSDDPVLVQL